MGTIKADTLTGLADPNKLTVPTTVTVGATILTDGSAGSTTITGEGGSTTTNLQQGLLKCWINMQGNATPLNIRDSFNQSSATDNGAADYTFNHTNNFSNAVYAAIGDVCNISSEVCIPFFNDDMATDHFNGESRQRSDGGVQDSDKTDWIWAGDLA